MRDAFGGVFSIQFLLVFLAIIICIVAIIMNYAKVFRVKNKVIDYIEQYQGYTTNAQEKIDDYLTGINYHVRLSNKDKQNASNNNYPSIVTNPNNLEVGDTYCDNHNYGYCVTKTSNKKGNYYLVTVYLNFNFPAVNINFNLPIRGETRVLMY